MTTLSPTSVSVSVIIPCHDEAGALASVLEEVIRELDKRKERFEVIVVDDGSEDNSPAVVRDFAARRADVTLVSLPRHTGKTAALSAGLLAAQGETIVTLDADGEDNPADIGRLLDTIDAGYDFVSGKRRRRSHSRAKRLLSHIFNIGVRIMFGTHTSDVNTGLKAARRAALERVPLIRDFHRFIPVFIEWLGYRTTEIEVTHRRRFAGKSKYGLERYFKAAADFILVFYLTRISGKLGSRAGPRQLRDDREGR